MKTLALLTTITVSVLLLSSCTKFESIFDENNEAALVPVFFSDDSGRPMDVSFDLIGALAKRMGYSGDNFAFVINDKSLLQDLVWEDGTILQWPGIDFEHYSLVAGHLYAPYPRVICETNQRIIVGISVITLYVQEGNRKDFERPGVLYTLDAMPSSKFFCCLYPKLPNRPVRIVRLRK